ncbi:MAG: hypothetical protein ACK4NV_13225 [Pannonibacter sp.]
MTQHTDQLSELIADYRAGIEDTIELLITLLDRLDGDSDLEPEPEEGRGIYRDF